MNHNFLTIYSLKNSVVIINLQFLIESRLIILYSVCTFCQIMVRELLQTQEIGELLM